MKRPADTGPARAARYQHRNERIRAIAASNPGLSSAAIAVRVGCGRRVVQRVVREMAAEGAEHVSRARPREWFDSFCQLKDAPPDPTPAVESKARPRPTSGVKP